MIGYMYECSCAVVKWPLGGPPKVIKPRPAACGVLVLIVCGVVLRDSDVRGPSSWSAGPSSSEARVAAPSQRPLARRILTGRLTRTHGLAAWQVVPGEEGEPLIGTANASGRAARRPPQLENLRPGQLPKWLFSTGPGETRIRRA
jgi:hypothetical protein